MAPGLDPLLISLRDLTKQDIPLILDYWYRSPPAFIESFGVDLKKLPEEGAFSQFLIEKCESNRLLPSSKLHSLIIEYAGEPVGFHTLNPLTEGESGVFHAHLLKPEMRRRGLGKRTYPLACRIFMERFNLKRILFKTPEQNTGAIRVKEALGIPCTGEEVVSFGIIRDGTRAKVFELDRAGLDRLFRPSHG